MSTTAGPSTAEQSWAERRADKIRVRPRALADLRRRLINRFSDPVVAAGHHLCLMGYGQMDIFGVDDNWLRRQADTQHGRVQGTQTAASFSMQIDERIASWPPEPRRMYSLILGVDLPETTYEYARLDHAALGRLPSPAPVSLDDVDPRHLVVSDGDRAEAVRRAAETVEHLKDVELFIADAEMCALLRTAQQVLPSQPLLATDPLTEAGFVYFPDPIVDPDNTEKPVGVHALSWQVDDWDGGKTVDREGKPLRKVTLCAWVSPEGLNLLPGIHPLDVITPLQRAEPLPLHIAWRYEWLVGEPHDQRTPTPKTRLGRTADPLVPTGYRQADWFTPGFHQRLITAFWTISRQKLAAVTEEPVDRPLRRQCARTGIRTASSPVRVVKFRQREDALASAIKDHPLDPAEGVPAPGEELGPDGEPVVPGRVYTCRWVVRGFWRNQWYSSENVHRAVWIAAHIKGPEGAPLIGSERVFLVEGR